MDAQLEKQGLFRIMNRANSYVTDILLTCNVPDSIDENDYDSYLLHSKKPAKKESDGAEKSTAASVDELEDRLNVIKNKMKTKKRPTSERALKKREAKKLKKNKEFKKVLVSAAKSIKNENQKHLAGADEESESKKDIKPVKTKPIYNKEGKMVFSKFDFSAHPGAKVKKSHQNPREILKKIKSTDNKLKELKEQGEVAQASELKNDIAWQNAFERVEGKKVKDDPKLLYKTIKKRKVEKKKSKKQWADRKNKVQSDIDQRQKKRQENLTKRSTQKKNRKLKKLSKQGRVIPGF